MSLYFNQEHEMFRQMVRRFVENEINPHVEKWEEERIFPAHALFQKAGELGLLGITYPEEYGGSGLDYWYETVMLEEIGRSNCAGVPMAIAVQAREPELAGRWVELTQSVGGRALLEGAGFLVEP